PSINTLYLHDALPILTVNSNNNGTTTFVGIVGGTGLLSNLTTNADGTTRIGANISTNITSGDQTFNDAVVLTNDITFSGNDLTLDRKSTRLNSSHSQI